jgi:hypothetical protein
MGRLPRWIAAAVAASAGATVISARLHRRLATLLRYVPRSQTYGGDGEPCRLRPTGRARAGAKNHVPAVRRIGLLAVTRGHDPSSGWAPGPT